MTLGWILAILFVLGFIVYRLLETPAEAKQREKRQRKAREASTQRAAERFYRNHWWR